MSRARHGGHRHSQGARTRGPQSARPSRQASSPVPAPGPVPGPFYSPPYCAPHPPAPVAPAYCPPAPYAAPYGAPAYAPYAAPAYAPYAAPAYAPSPYAVGAAAYAPPPYAGPYGGARAPPPGYAADLRPPAARGPAPVHAPRLAALGAFRLERADFEVGALIGKGSFGSVFRGVDRRTGWPVAVKELAVGRLPQKEIEFFQREVEILAACQHPFLVRMVGFVLAPAPAIVTEFLPEGSLWDHIRRRRYALSANQRMNIAVGVARGMRFLHARSVIHRDLKSGNILLDDRMLPRIADFGLGKAVGAAALEATRAAGTVQWMPPEQLFSAEYSFPVDVYAYGMVLYELLCECVPFEGMTQVEVFRRIERGEMPLLPPVFQGHPVADVVRRCWSYRPEDRPTFDWICEAFDAGAVALPYALPAGIAEIRRIVGRVKRDGIWNAQRLAVELQQGEAGTVWEAAQQGDIQGFAKALALTEEMDADARDPQGRTPLFIAAEAGNAMMIVFLGEIEGVDINARARNGDTPLIAAVRRKRCDAVRALNGTRRANAAEIDGEGKTALHIAVTFGPLEIVKALLSRPDLGILLAVADRQGKVPKELAMVSPYSDVQRLFEAL